MRFFFLAFLFVLLFLSEKVQGQAVSWGDQGNGTYINPILNADYSDPDVIRVGDKYYMVCSDFHYIGMPVLESDDMVNWRIISQVYNRFDFPGWDNNENYGGGSWAPAIRFHDGKFWIYFCTPREGLMMSTATDPHGPWTPLHCVKNIGGWEDPCPFWDEDGQAYMGRSQLGAGPIYLHRMTPDGKTLLDDGKIIYTGPVAEGTKFYKRHGYYYLSIPEGGVGEGWQTILRSKNIYGPYKKKVVLEQGNTTVNGPHQGALVDTPEGEWWFFHFQLTEPLGRVVHLQPVCWMENWPVIGVDMDMNGIGEPVKVWTKPGVSKSVLVSHPQTTDDFSSYTLGLQWQFNHNPVNTHWSLNERRGWLALKALKAATLRESRNMLTQKCMGYLSTATVLLDFSALADGQRGGLFCTGSLYNGIGISREEGKNYLYLEKNGDVQQVKMVSGKKIYLRVMLDAKKNRCQLFYSFDNRNFILCGDAYSLKFGDWKGARVGLYSYNTLGIGGKCYFDWFNYDFN